MEATEKRTHRPPGTARALARLEAVTGPVKRYRFSFKYERNYKTPRGKVIMQPAALHCVAVVTPKGQVFMGAAKPSAKDQYWRAFGMSLAEKRALDYGLLHADKEPNIDPSEMTEKELVQELYKRAGYYSLNAPF